ncbi:MAG: methyltransferase domain-containing protein [Methylocystis sp.]|uniref:methyltransferase domain-containing protein n=1 Tax=Methylocystis sp. TaxID=1911079 RepID=UPI00392EAE5F
MHDTAYEIGRLFFEAYGRSDQLIVEFGSCDVNGSLRDFCPEGAAYLGLDIGKGPSVDIFLDEGKPIPLRDEFADIVVSSSVLEHDRFFWDSFLEMARVLKPGGILYLNVPSNGYFHRYPADCWRFYPDSGKALEALARTRGYPFTLVECFIAERKSDVWNDFVAIYAKADEAGVTAPKFLSDSVPCSNVIRLGVEEVDRFRPESEDMIQVAKLKQESAALAAALAEETSRAQTAAATLQASHLAEIAAKDAIIAQLTQRLEAPGRTEKNVEGS